MRDKIFWEKTVKIVFINFSFKTKYILLNLKIYSNIKNKQRELIDGFKKFSKDARHQFH